MKYPFVFYVDKESIFPNGGLTHAFIIRIAKEYKDDEGLLAHELNHVKNWLVFGLIAFFATCILLSRSVLEQLGVSLNLNYNDIFTVSGVIGFSFYGLMYVLSKKFRYNQEFQCYKIQLNTYSDTENKPRRAQLFAGFIKNRYKNCTNLSEQEITEKLLQN